MRDDRSMMSSSVPPASGIRRAEGGRVVIFAVAGLASAFFGIAIGHLVASWGNPAFAPISVVASSAIDLPPAVVKEWAVQTFGTATKSVVVVVVAAFVSLLAVVAGICSRTRLWLGVVILVGMSVIGVIAAIARPDDGLGATIPALVAGVAAPVALIALVHLARGGVATREATDPLIASQPVNRRAVLLGTLGFAGLGAVALAGSTASNTRVSIATPSASSAATSPSAPVVPAGALAPIVGLPPFITPNDAFYRIDTAVVVPQVAADRWTLDFGGMVRNPFTLTYDELMRQPMIDRDVTIMCVSNPVGGEYIGTARWTGTPLMPLLEQAGVDAGAEQLFSTSIDGWTCSTPLDGLARREPLLVVAMNGEPLPIDHGYPVRMIVPGLYGFISATKWITSIEAATYADMPAYWTVRGWATDAPVLTGSVIKVPNSGVLSAGPTNLGGVAWAMDGNGVSQVEVQIDDGPWQPAKLADAVNPVTWRQWWLPWQATPGVHVLRVRATNGRGEVQTGAERDVIPAGATGWHTVAVEVAA